MLNLRTGDVTSYQLTTEASFVNDVVLTHRQAWFTDSQLPQLYALPLGRHGRLPDPSKVITLPLTGDWDPTPGASVANGITETPDHWALLVVSDQHRTAVPRRPQDRCRHPGRSRGNRPTHG